MIRGPTMYRPKRSTRLKFIPKKTIEDAVRDICRAFLAGKLPNSMTDDRYFNVRVAKKTGIQSETEETAIVTGAAGFIGSHMVDLLLDRGYVVRGIDNLIGGRVENLAQHRTNSKFSLEIADLRSLSADHDVFKDADICIHFAGIGDIVPSIEHPVDYMSANIMGTVHALEGARAGKVRKFVYAASSSCYGIAAELPTTENAPIRKYPYALSKYLGERSVLHWGSVYKLPVTCIRIFNAYGPRSRTTGAYGAVFGVFLAQKLAGRPFTVVGDGTQTRDFVFVTDVARAFLMAAESNKLAKSTTLVRTTPNR